MAFFRKNPNEFKYTGGEKHFADVIKNTGAGELLLWLNGEEDFNTNSTLIVAESEEALFFKDGIIEQIFDGGKYTLSTSNYPFISRLRNVLTGGISSFNCKVYFVRKAHSIEILWGTDTPIQVRDPLQGIATSVQARGSYKIQVADSKKFLLKLIGNNVKFTQQVEMNLYFRNEFLQYIKSAIAKFIKSSDQEILGICSEQETLATGISQQLRYSLDSYGLSLITFSIAGIDIPANDPNRKMLEEVYTQKRIMGVLGEDWARQQSVDILKGLANNPGAGGVAAMGAGIGVGVAAGGALSGIAQAAFAPSQSPTKTSSVAQSGLSTGKCGSCGSEYMQNAKFCTECGSKIEPKNFFCSECGAELLPEAKFCTECGAKRS